MSNKFSNTVEKVNRLLGKAKESAETVQILYEKGDMQEAYDECFRLESLSEKIVLNTRSLPVHTGNPRAERQVSSIIKEEVPVEIGYTKEGWFSLRLPLLLPKKGKGSTDYLKDILFPAMDRYYHTHRSVCKRYHGAVLVFRHVYTEDRQERLKRDHDNIEVNTVADIVTLYVLIDDAPAYCSHFYCSGVGDKERTEVYVIPRSEFAKWLEVEKTMPKEGVKLYETP